MWTRQDHLRFVVGAVGAFGLTLGVFWTSPSHADRKTPMPEIIVPTFHAGVCDITATVAPSENVLDAKGSQVFIAPGKLPPVSLVIHNTSDQPAKAEFRVSFGQFKPIITDWRVPPSVRIDSQIQQQIPTQPVSPPPGSYDISLAPNETKTIDVSNDSVTLGNDGPAILLVSEASGDKSTTMLWFAVKPAADTATAAANANLIR